MKPVKKERILVKDAILIKKEGCDYFPMPGKEPTPQTFCQLIFDTIAGQKIFQVNLLLYRVVEEGDRGDLIFEGNDLISFGEYIKEFKM